MEDIRDRICRVLKAQTQATITPLSSLLAVHDEIGYIPQEAIEEVAEFTNSTVNDIWGVASFYTNFRFTVPGDHSVEVCWGPTCHLVGAMDLLQAVQDVLEVEGESDTNDGRVTLKYNTCLGACAQAPVIKVGEKIIGQMTVERARGLVANLREPESI